MESAIGINMCRCCASEGSYKDLNTKFTWMGETEIYADMLQYCFDINLEKEESDNGGICEVCITQLRHASNFKKQVLITEEKFKKRLQEKLFSRDAIKLEMNEVSIDSDNDNRVMDDFSEPEYDIPIKEEIEVEVKPKKRSAKASTSTTSRVKKPKNEEGEPSNKRGNIGTSSISCEATASNPIRIEEPEVYGNESNVPVEPFEVTAEFASGSTKATRIYIKINKKVIMHKHLENIRTILLNSNATLVKHKTMMQHYCCHFCELAYKDTHDLKKHVLEKHSDGEIKSFVVNSDTEENSCLLDITNLKCNFCDVKIKTLDELMNHLSVHGKEIHKDIAHRVLSFRVENKKLICPNCLSCFEDFNVLVDHIKTHYKNYQCIVCAAKFESEPLFYNHAYIHKIGKFPCSHCNKVFSSQLERQNHEYYIHCGYKKKYICLHCPERFLTQSLLTDHMMTKHGMITQSNNTTAKNTEANTSNRQTLEATEDVMMMRKHLQNARAILLNTNATPIKGQTALNACYYCSTSFGNMSDLKKHTLEKHDDNEKKAFMGCSAFFFSYSCKLDITNLKCKLCKASVKTLEGMMDHLIEHDVEIHKDIDNHILAFKVKNNEFRCGKCNKYRSHSLKNVVAHIKVHYKNYKCDTCPAAFINKSGLHQHLHVHSDKITSGHSN